MRYCSVVLCLKRRKLQAAGSPPSIAAEINNRQRQPTSTSTPEDIHCAPMRPEGALDGAGDVSFDGSV